MGLDIWFTEDIRNALLAANEASSSTARVCGDVGGDAVTLRAYLEGYRAALTTVALAFGLNPNVMQQQVGDTLVIPAKGVLYHDQERDDPKPAHRGHGQLIGRPGRPGSGL